MKSNIVRRRGIRRIAGLGMAATMLTLTAACGGGGSGSGGDGDVVLRFSWWGSDVRHEYTQELIDKFEAENPGISIEPEFTGWEDYWNRLATNVAGRNAPDIMQQDTRYVREYADRGALADLTPYLGEQIDDSNFDPAVKDFGATDEGLFAIPTGINAFSVVVDPQLYSDAGVDVPDDTTWTWDQFVDTTSSISKSGDIFGTQDPGFVETSFEVFARQRGEALFTEEGIGFSEGTLRDWFDLIAELRDTGAEPPASTTVEVQAGGIDQSLLSTNDGAGGFWWTNELPTLEANSGHDLQLMRFPGESEHKQPGMYLKPAMFWAVSAQSEHPEEAAKFVDFLLNNEEVAKVQLADRGLPINTALREQITPDLDASNQESAEFLAEITPDLAESPVLPPQGAGEVQEIMQRLNEEILFDQITVDEAVERFTSEVESALG